MCHSCNKVKNKSTSISILILLAPLSLAQVGFSVVTLVLLLLFPRSKTINCNLYPEFIGTLVSRTCMFLCCYFSATAAISAIKDNFPFLFSLMLSYKDASISCFNYVFTNVQRKSIATYILFLF